MGGRQRPPIPDLRLGSIENAGYCMNRYSKLWMALVGEWLVGIFISNLSATEPPPPKSWSVIMTDAVISRHPQAWTIDEANPSKWEYTYGVVLKAVLEVWAVTGNQHYWQYVESYYDHFIDEQGQILTYKQEEYNIDRICPGKVLFRLYQLTGKEKYRLALLRLRQQMREQPRTPEGGFWHKKIYPQQMWLDGLYMGAPFLAEYARTMDEPELFNDITRQFVLMEKQARDPRTGLLYHGWDASRQQRWADPITGCSSQFWGRAVGWYAMALVDALDFFPPEHPGRDSLVAILNRLAVALAKVQDSQSGLWYQVLDKAGDKGNYLEASASCMFVYSLTKGVRQGYLSEAQCLPIARRGYAGILGKFITTDSTGQVVIGPTCSVAGLGGNPYRDGSYQYYVSTPQNFKDPKAIGPFILASLEMETKQGK